MATRKIIDIEQNGEKVWPKGHAKATFMSNGTTVEDAINSIQTDIGGGIVSETDPIFSASPAASITEEKKTEWDNKVDKVSGKGLSTEDFTTALKTKLEGLSNYDDTELSEALSTLRGDFDALVSGDTTTAIETFNEVTAFLDGIQDTQDLSSIIASIEQQIAGKMDKVTLATVATSGSYNDLSNKPTIPSEQVNADWNATSGKAQILNKPTIPSAVTESTVSGWGFTKNTGTYSKPSGGIPKSDLASAVQTSLGKADTALQSYTEQYKGTVTGVKINGTTKNPSSGVVDLGTVITSHQDISGKADKSSLAAVATSGSYNDLTDQPDFIKSVAINGTTIADTSGTVYLPNASTGGYGVTKLNTSTSSTSTMESATPSAVKAAYDLANSKQDKLESGTNIKTINGQSIVGSGNLIIEGGSTDGFVTKEKVGELDVANTNALYDGNTVYALPSSANGDEDDILVSERNLKTINGQSLIGSGDIEISGGLGGGEDIRYFTEFTVEDFIKACEIADVVTYDTTELFNAMKSNKVICVPYRGFDKGFIVASYRSEENKEYSSMYIQKGDVEYWAFTGDYHELVGDYPIFNSVQVVEMAGGEEVLFEILDNRIYRITDPVDFLMPVPNNVVKGATIQFISGNSGTTLELYGALWANGEIPQIEPNTHYELSLMANSTYDCNAVLTPFKYVE